MWTDVLIILLKVVVVLVALLNMGALLTWAERKQSAAIQDRIGPNRARIAGRAAMGLFHAVADGIKMVTKEDFVPAGAHRTLHTLAPAAALFPALVVFAAIPFGDVLHVGERVIPLQIADLNVGIVYIFAISSMAVYGTMLAGWASNNNYALLGGLRASAQMISYEITMGLSIIGVLMIYETAQLNVIVQKQGELLWGFLPKWGIVVQPAAFFLFLAAAMAENKRVPFDLPEGESEIIGYFVEYSSMKFAMFFLAEFVEIVIVSGLVVTLFFGGWQVPYLYADGFHWPFGWGVWQLPHLPVVLLQVASFGFKVLIGCWILLTVRWTLPRFRYDQVMHLGWKILLELGIRQRSDYRRRGAVDYLIRVSINHGSSSVLDFCGRRHGLRVSRGMAPEPHEQRHLPGDHHVVPGRSVRAANGRLCGDGADTHICRSGHGSDVVRHHDAQPAFRYPGARGEHTGLGAGRRRRRGTGCPHSRVVFHWRWESACVREFRHHRGGRRQFVQHVPVAVRTCRRVAADCGDRRRHPGQTHDAVAAWSSVAHDPHSVLSRHQRHFVHHRGRRRIAAP